MIKIRIKDFYKNYIGEMEFVYVNEEVYEALAHTFRKEAHAEEMRDLRHLISQGYLEGETEEVLLDISSSVEEKVMKQIEIEKLKEAMQSLTKIQRERLHLYFFEGLTFRQIGEQMGISDKSVRESIDASLKKLKNFLE